MRDHYFIISLFNNDCVVPLKRDKIVCVEDNNNIESKRGFFGKIQHMYMKCYHNEVLESVAFLFSYIIGNCLGVYDGKIWQFERSSHIQRNMDDIGYLFHANIK